MESLQSGAPTFSAEQVMKSPAKLEGGQRRRLCVKEELQWEYQFATWKGSMWYNDTEMLKFLSSEVDNL